MRNENPFDSKSIFKAAEMGDIDKLQAALDSGVDIKAFKDSLGNTVLHFAAKGGQVEVLKWLKEKGFNLNEAINDGRNIGHAAAEFGRFNVLEWLLEIRFDLSAKAKVGEAAMVHFAAKGGQVEVLKWLKEKGFNLNEAEKNGGNIGHLAAYCGRLNVLEWLLESRFDLSAKTKLGDTLAHFAARGGQVEVLKWLNEKGFNINETLKNEGNIGHVAARFGRLDVLEWLLETRFDLSVKTQTGATVVHFAASGGQVEVLEWLEDKGFNLNEATKNGRTIAHIVASYGHLDMLQWLCEKGIDVNAKTVGGVTVFECLVATKQFESLEWLYKNGQKYHLENNDRPLLELVLNKQFKGNEFLAAQHSIFQTILRNHPGCLLNEKNEMNEALLLHCQKFLDENHDDLSRDSFYVRTEFTKIYINKNFASMLELADHACAKDFLKSDIEALLSDKNPLFYEGFEEFLKVMLCHYSHRFSIFALSFLGEKLYEQYCMSIESVKDDKSKAELLSNLKLSTLCFLASSQKNPDLQKSYFYSLCALLKTKYGIEVKGNDISDLYKGYFGPVLEILNELKELLEHYLGESIDRGPSVFDYPLRMVQNAKIAALEQEIQNLRATKREDQHVQNSGNSKKPASLNVTCTIFNGAVKNNEGKPLIDEDDESEDEKKSEAKF